MFHANLHDLGKKEKRKKEKERKKVRKKERKKKWTKDVCCVFPSSNGYFPCHFLVKVNFFSIFDFSTSNARKKEEMQAKNGKTEKTGKKDINQHLGVTPKRW